MVDNNPFQQMIAYATAMGIGALLLFGAQQYGKFKFAAGQKHNQQQE